MLSQQNTSILYFRLITFTLILSQLVLAQSQVKHDHGLLTSYPNFLRLVVFSSLTHDPVSGNTSTIPSTYSEPATAYTTGTRIKPSDLTGSQF